MLNNDLANIKLTLSLSARRAWIEIAAAVALAAALSVALRKESVDRNIASAKRAVKGLVALRKESVDRNRMPHLS